LTLRVAISLATMASMRLRLATLFTMAPTVVSCHDWSRNERRLSSRLAARARITFAYDSFRTLTNPSISD